MKFKPLEPTGKTSGGVACGYTILNQNKGNLTLAISVSPELIRPLNPLKQGDWLRLDADTAAGVARLLPVLNGASKASRKARVSGSGRLSFHIPYSGDIPSAFPLVKGMTALEHMQSSRDEGIIFKLPGRAKK
jgi:hypothetical protein